MARFPDNAVRIAGERPLGAGLAAGVLAACRMLLIALLAASSAHGQPAGPGPRDMEGATVIEIPDAQVPLALEFQDEDGKPVRLADFFKPDRPVLLTMVYYQCPMLCNRTLNAMVKQVKPLKLEPGRDFEIVIVSFHPKETPELAKAKKANYLKELGRPESESGWHFLSCHKDPQAARTLGDALGFGYKPDPESDNYFHQAALYICTPEGRVARTIVTLDFDTELLNDSLINASQGKISRGLFGVALSCGLFQYDHAEGKYTWAAMAIMRVVGIGSVLVLAAVIGTLMYRDAHRRRGLAESGST